MVCSMVESGGYLDFGTWAGECITDPDLCASGLTITMWLRIQAKDINYNSEYQYIISSGAEGESMRGIVFLLKVRIVYMEINLLMSLNTANLKNLYPLKTLSSKRYTLKSKPFIPPAISDLRFTALLYGGEQNPMEKPTCSF